MPFGNSDALIRRGMGVGDGEGVIVGVGEGVEEGVIVGVGDDDGEGEGEIVGVGDDEASASCPHQVPQLLLNDAYSWIVHRSVSLTGSTAVLL